jgi:DNA-binding beta-propeller fold protein YncE
MQEPVDLVVDAEGNLDVLDGERSVIERFASDGTYRQTLPLAKEGVFRPRGLSIDPQGNLYVADTGGSRVLQLSGAGQVLRQWDNQGGYDLNQPTGVAVDATGNVYVAEPIEGRLDKIAADGAVVAVRRIDTSDTLLGPHIAIAPNGQIVVTAPARSNVAVFDSDLSEVATLGQGATPFQQPVGIAVAPDGTYWVADPGAVQVIGFSP